MLLFDLEQSRNYFCTSCLTVYNPADVDEESNEIYRYLYSICEEKYTLGRSECSIGDVNYQLTSYCGECSKPIEIYVVVTATAVFAEPYSESESDSETEISHIWNFEDIDDIEIKEVLPRDTSNFQVGLLMEDLGLYDSDDFDFGWNDNDDWYDYCDDLPSIGEYDFTQDQLNLLIIVKTKMNNGYCFIGWDMISGGLVRPILRTATNQCCWQETDPVLDVGQQHRFQVYSRNLKEIPFPHKSNDVLVHYLESIPAEEITMFDLLGAESCNRVEDVFNGADIKERRYVIEGDMCPSAGIYRCSGKNLSVFDFKFRDGNMKKRCQIIEGEITFLFPITALQPYFPTNEDVLVIIGLARPFPGYNGEYNPKRCTIIVLGIIPKPN